MMEFPADPMTANCRKMHAGLKMMGVDYSLTKIDCFQGEQKSSAYLEVDPVRSG